MLHHRSASRTKRKQSARIRETSGSGRRSAQAWSVHERRNPSWQPWGSETSAWLRSFAKVFHYRVERVPSSLFHPSELPDVELRCSRPRLAHTRNRTSTCKLVYPQSLVQRRWTLDLSLVVIIEKLYIHASRDEYFYLINIFSQRFQNEKR